MALDGLSGTAIVSMIVIGFLVAVELIALTVLFVAIQKLVRDIYERMDPLAVKVNTLMDTVNDLAQNVQSKTEHIAEKTAKTTDDVSERVEKTSELMQGVVATPIIKGMALMEGLVRGTATWSRLRRAHAARRRQQAEATPPPAEETVTVIVEETVIPEEGDNQ
ncbi:MAG: DUF948 domain-containing protein [Armatimonadota bacterium]